MVETAAPEMVAMAVPAVQEMVPATVLEIRQTLARQFINSAKTQPILSPLLVSDYWQSALQPLALAHRSREPFFLIALRCLEGAEQRLEAPCSCGAAIRAIEYDALCSE